MKDRIPESVYLDIPPVELLDRLSLPALKKNEPYLYYFLRKKWQMLLCHFNFKIAKKFILFGYYSSLPNGKFEHLFTWIFIIRTV